MWGRGSEFSSPLEVDLVIRGVADLDVCPLVQWALNRRALESLCEAWCKDAREIKERCEHLYISGRGSSSWSLEIIHSSHLFFPPNCLFKALWTELLLFSCFSPL